VALNTRHQFPEILNLKGLILAQQQEYAVAFSSPAPKTSVFCASKMGQ
jgi:hypothetical protein